MLLLLIIYSQICLFTLSGKMQAGCGFLLNIAEIIWKVETNVLRAQTNKKGFEVKQNYLKIRMWIILQNK